MRAIALAAVLQPLKLRYDEALTGAPQNRATSETGRCYLRIDPDRVGETPSMNGNHVTFPGVAAPTSREQLRAIQALFRAHGVRRYFVELSPCAQQAELRGWLQEAGMVPFDGAGYPTLLRPGSAPVVPPVAATDCVLRVAPLTAEEAHGRMDELRAAIGFGPWATYFARAIAEPDVAGFAAYDGARLVAAAGLFTHGDLGYLGVTGTRESHRRRGAQGALIAARVTHCQTLGLGQCVSETLYRLTSSLNNLRRAGFEVIYDKEMWTPRKTSAKSADPGTPPGPPADTDR